MLPCYVDGIEAYFAFRNSEGGMQGRQMALTTVLDDELTNNQARALEIVSDRRHLRGLQRHRRCRAAGATSPMPGIPLYTWSIHPKEMAGRESTFGYTGVLCTSCANRNIMYPGTLVDATKVATLGYGISPSSKECANGTADAVGLYGDDTGMEVVYKNDEIAFGLPNGVGPEVTAMKEAGVDFIYGCLDLNGMKTVAQELERQGMADVHMFHPNTYDAAFVAESDGLFEGDIVGVTFRPFEADPGDSQLADFQKWMGETGSEISELAMVGWINADLAYQGLIAAGPQFDRAVGGRRHQRHDRLHRGRAHRPGRLVPPARGTDQRGSRDPRVGPQLRGLRAGEGQQLRAGGRGRQAVLLLDGSSTGWSEPTPSDIE